jgi:hypothetical protein
MAAVVAMAAFVAVRLARGDKDGSGSVDRGLLTGLNLAIFLAFLANAWITANAFIVIYLSELIVPYLRVFARQSGRPLSARWSEYLKLLVHTAAQVLVIWDAVGHWHAIGNFPLTNPYEQILLAQLCALVSIICVLDHGIATARRIGPAQPAE